MEGRRPFRLDSCEDAVRDSCATIAIDTSSSSCQSGLRAFASGVRLLLLALLTLASPLRAERLILKSYTTADGLAGRHGQLRRGRCARLSVVLHGRWAVAIRRLRVRQLRRRRWTAQRRRQRGRSPHPTDASGSPRGRIGPLRSARHASVRTSDSRSSFVRSRPRRSPRRERAPRPRCSRRSCPGWRVGRAT